jgi:hypothetical protein
LNPVADAFVTTGPSGNLANNNYGGGGSLAVAAAGLPQGEFQSVMRFDLAPAVSAFNSEFGAGNWTVGSVTLQLNLTTAANGIFNAPGAGAIGISWMQNDSWLEGAGTPNAPGASGITFNTLQNSFRSAADEKIGTLSFDGTTMGFYSAPLTLTPGFTGDLNAAGETSLRFSADDSGISAIFNSRSFSTTSLRPVLSIEAIPEPTTIALAALGFAVVFRKRR